MVAHDLGAAAKALDPKRSADLWKRAPRDPEAPTRSGKSQRSKESRDALRPFHRAGGYHEGRVLPWAG